MQHQVVSALASIHYIDGVGKHLPAFTCIDDGLSCIVCAEEHIFAAAMLLKQGLDAGAIVHNDSICKQFRCIDSQQDYD